MTTLQNEINARVSTSVKQAQDFARDAIKNVNERVQPLLPTSLPTPSALRERALDLGGVLLQSAKNVATEATKPFSQQEPAKAVAAKKAAVRS